MPSEREVKLAVPAAFSLPPLDGIADGVRAVDRGTHALDATYWDTDSLALFHSECGLRHRTRDGGEGVWTLKGPSSMDGSAVVREETEMAGTPDEVPAELLERIRPLAGGGTVHPVARLHTERHIVDVERSGERCVEVADDHVRVLDADGNEASRFREVELEVIGEGVPAILDSLVERVERAGGRPDSTAKYVRALEALGLIRGRPEGR